MATHTPDVTVVGWIGSEVRSFHTDDGGVPFAQFRLGATRRFFDRQSGAFRDGPTVWYTVKAWRQTALNLGHSLRKGDPVLVVGRLATSEWVAQDGPRTDVVIEATAVGHDLTYGTAHFRRAMTTRPSTDDGTDAGDAGEDRAGERDTAVDVSDLVEAPQDDLGEGPVLPEDGADVGADAGPWGVPGVEEVEPALVGRE